MGTEIRDEPDRQRYEILVDDALAGFAEYRGGEGTTRAFTHTEIDERYEGQGLGGRLVAWALDDVRAKGLHVLPMCPFVKAYLARHPEQLDLVEPAMRRAFGLPDPVST